MKKTFPIFIVLVAFVPAASSQVTLEIKYHENSTVKARHIHKSSQTTTILGVKATISHMMVGADELVIGARAADGTLRAKRLFKTLNFKIEGLGLKAEFDSADPDRKSSFEVINQFFDFFRFFLKHPITYVFKKDNSVKGVEVNDEAARDLPENFRAMLEPKVATAELRQRHEMLPDKAVSKGDTWVRSQVVDLGGFRMMSFRIDFKYEGAVNKNGRALDRISGEITDVRYVGKGWSVGPGEVKNAELKPAKSSVGGLFDRKLGRFVETNFQVQIKGGLTLEVAGVELPGKAKLDMTFEQGMKVLPPEKK
jgi:hypothetical protein